MLVAEGLSCLGRSPLQSTTRPASSPTVLGPQRAVGGQSGWSPCAPPWPATPRTVRRGASQCAGGSPASAVGRLPARLCPASGLPSQSQTWVCNPHGPLPAQHSQLAAPHQVRRPQSALQEVTLATSQATPDPAACDCLL